MKFTHGINKITIEFEETDKMNEISYVSSKIHSIKAILSLIRERD